MALFQKSVVKSQLEKLDEDLIQQSWETYKSYFLDASKQKIIFEKKEEELQYEFLLQLFDKSLGYDIGVGNQNLFVEQKNQTDSKKADGAIKINGEIVCVIELKSTKTKNLKNVEKQAFGYKVSHPNCKYVVTSNFNKLRFYIDNTTDFEEFDLFNLTNDRFKLLWLCLSYDSIYSNKPLDINKESLVNEEKITRQLYKDYSKFRLNLFADLKENNPQVTPEILLQKTQKLLDRMLFILFSEDRGLLPSNSITEIINYWDNKKEFGDDETLYDTYVTYFNVINKGRPQRGNKEAIYAYNGGLFIDDEILDNLVISDDLLLKYSKKLTAYDFESEISVNILGHIFEHSLNEIEELQSQIGGQELDKSKSKRKKDGVFYTPQYITKYIVENTVGKLCEEKKIELNIVEEEYLKGRKGRPKNKLESLRDILEEYRKWLLELTICDPACGSGAFLNQALEFLISEHNYIDELQNSLLGGGFKFPEVENSILENNLYGVDINKESVEIAKLSLWLRTAQKGRKLTSLSDNLKCGNSLIDEPEVAGDKAFNWKNEFPEIFKNGGFDVVIGNPPYVRQELFKEIKPYLEKAYECFNSVADLYTYFVEKGIDLLCEKGKFSFILPNKFLKSNYGKEIRKVIKEKTNIELLFDFDDFPVFESATTYPIIFVLNKKKDFQLGFFKYAEINKRTSSTDPLLSLENKSYQVSIKSLGENSWTFESTKSREIINKIKNSSTPLTEFVNKGINRGILTGKNDVFIFKEELKNELVKKGAKSDIIKPILLGSAVKRYHYNYENDYILFTRRGIDIEQHPVIKNYLEPFYEDLRPRNNSEKTGRKAGQYKWFEIQDNIAYYNDFEVPKIVYPRTNKTCNFQLDTKGYYLSDNNFYIKSASKPLLGLLNSKLVFFFLKNICTTLQGGYYDFRRDKVDTIPISNLLNDNKELEELVDTQIKQHEQYREVKNFLPYFLNSKINGVKISNKIQNWVELEVGEFLKELEKARKKTAKENKMSYSELSVSEEAGWMIYFNEQKQKAQTLKTQINQTDKEIDQTVYELYGLTKEEIEIVENS